MKSKDGSRNTAFEEDRACTKDLTDGERSIYRQKKGDAMQTSPEAQFELIHLNFHQNRVLTKQDAVLFRLVLLLPF